MTAKTTSSSSNTTSSTTNNETLVNNNTQQSLSSDQLDNQDIQWQAVNEGRAAIYRWFADMFARELTPANLEQLNNHYQAMHQAFSGMGLAEQSVRLQQALSHLSVIVQSDRALELAADFAQIFLLSGQDSAPPYASYYIEADKMLYGKPAQQMAQFLKSHQLDLHPDFREPKDHISVYLQVMAVWINASMEQPGTVEEQQTSIAHRQGEFLDSALLNWLPKFSARCQKIGVKTDVYPALTELLLAFVDADRQALTELL
ncbi:molecular chaperone TorD [Psychrobacter sp. FDAARGOS_221]|uniref:molecular chaperone TorD n=1 Tax=Psychrobacter sp. FDAARGOS_221 TaxID=1975705 RepID=UPI000BB5583A|nr:molecular chaperone TorD [Psychrobacter sp. FDAARGOS_221]PNK60525.1 molecular chaperone TorD [Psychrobacter sp. FDAARGOS_221]